MRQLKLAILFLAGAAAKSENQFPTQPMSLMLFQEQPAPSVCYQPLDNITLHPQSPMAAWAPDWPSTAAQHIRAEECFCETAMNATETKATRKAIQAYSQLAEYDALYISFTHLVEREKLNPKQVALRIKEYCNQQLAFMENTKKQNTAGLAFAPSKALDYMLNWLAYHGLWDSAAPFFKQGMENFSTDLTQWVKWSEEMKLPMVNAFIHYLQSSYDLEKANQALQATSTAQQLNQLPVRFDIRNCIAVSPNRHTYFNPFFTSPLAPWIRKPDPKIMAILNEHRGVVCRNHFANPEDFNAAAVWDTRELQIAALEIMVATSTAIMQGTANINHFALALEQTIRLARDQNFSLHPSEAIDYTIGLLKARKHLTPLVSKLLLRCMSNYGNLNDWLHLAENLNWQFVKELIRPHTQTQKISPVSLFAQANSLFAVGADSLTRMPRSGAG